MTKLADSKADLLNKFQLTWPTRYNAAGITALENEYTAAELKSLLIYNLDTDKLWFHNGTTWEVITSAV